MVRFLPIDNFSAHFDDLGQFNRGAFHMSVQMPCPNPLSSGSRSLRLHMFFFRLLMHVLACLFRYDPKFRLPPSPIQAAAPSGHVGISSLSKLPIPVLFSEWMDPD